MVYRPWPSALSREKGIAKQNPAHSQGVLPRPGPVLIHGAFIGGVSLLTIGGRYQLDLAVARSATFAVLALSQLFYSFSTRSVKESLLELGFSSNPQIIYAFFGSGLLQLSVMLIPAVAKVFDVVPMGLEVWMRALGMAMIPMLIVETIKVLQRASQ